jgi:uncharacterized protein (TIGR00255 family)
MIRSMTGFGRASGEVGAKYFVTVAAKSVNHRYLETSVRVPEVLWEMEQPIRSLAAEIFSRGKVDVSVRSQRIHEPDYSVRINRRVADAVIPQVKTIADELGVDSRFTVADLLRIPDLLEVQPTDADLNESERADLLAIVRDAFQQLLANRKREGEALREDIATRTRNVRETGKSVAALRPQVQEEALNSYRERVAELAQSAGVTVPEERIAQEVVFQVEKGDIAEEITRLEIHLREVEKLLDSPEAAGKRLDFLSQEILREINTMGSKSRSAQIRSAVVELKTEVERIREQVQNVE